MKLNPYFALYTRINIDLNVTRKTIKFLEEKQEIILVIHVRQKELLYKIPKPQSIKEKKKNPDTLTLT